MSDRIALLEQRLADLEAECAGLAVVSVFLLDSNREGLDVDEGRADEIIEAVRARWPEVEEANIRRVMHGLLLLQWGRRRTE